MSIVLHGSSSVVKDGGRKIARMSEEEFFEKIRRFVGDSEPYENEDDAADAFFRHMFGNMTNIIAKDFKGMVFSGTYKSRNYQGEYIDVTVNNERHFDLENFEGDLCDVDGCPYFLVDMCGGDWQIPFCFMAYHDGKNFRVFVPTYGNNWIPFTKGGVKCKGLIGEYSPDTGYEYEGEPDWKFILKAIGNRYNRPIIYDAVKSAERAANTRAPEYFIKNYGFDPTYITEFENFNSYATKKANEFLMTLKKKGDIQELSSIDEYILKHLKYAIFSVLTEGDDVEETDVDNCIYEFESRVEPFDL